MPKLSKSLSFTSGQYLTPIRKEQKLQKKKNQRYRNKLNLRNNYLKVKLKCKAEKANYSKT